MSEPSAERVRRKRSALAGCGMGCMGLACVAAAIFVVAFGATGSYKPRITPHLPLPNPNAFDDYLAAGSLLKASGGTRAMYGPTGVGSPSLAAEQAIVAANQPALTRLRQGFTKQCVVPSGRSFTAMFPYLADSRNMARLLAADADVKAARGDPFRAFDAGLDGIRLGEDMQRGGLIIHGLVGVAIQAILREPIVRSLEHLSADDCDVLAARMQSILLTRVGFDQILEEERNSSLTSLMNLRNGEMAGLINFGNGGNDPPKALQTVGGVYWHFMRDRTLRDLEECFAAQERETRKPAAHRQPVPEPKSRIAAMIGGIFMQAAAKFDETDTRDRLILIALRIRSCRLRNGRLPASLGQLGIDPSLLMDPYTGGQLIYKPQGADYLLYSVGPDIKDDGGVPADEQTNDTTSPPPANGIPQGDMGIRAFRHTPRGASTASPNYRRVPHMSTPRLKPGWKPLPD